MLSLIPWFVIAFFLVWVIHVERYGPYVMGAVFILTFLMVLYLFERVVLIERRVFSCRQCGYDLQGLVDPRCPECGTPFDPTEKARIHARIGAPVPKLKRRWLVVILIVILAILLFAGFWTRLTSRPKTRPGPPNTANTGQSDVG